MILKFDNIMIVLMFKFEQMHLKFNDTFCTPVHSLPKYLDSI